MTTLESWMPGDLEIANKYIDKARTLRSILAESENEPLLSLVDGFTRATVHFGRCELHMHVADRNEALNSKAANVSPERKRAKNYHARGMQELSQAKAKLTLFVDRTTSSVDEQAVKQIWKNLDSDIRTSWVEALGDLDMKPSDAEKLRNVMSECCTAAAGGFKSLSEHIVKQFDELERVRKTPTRGTENNWPVWKLAAVAIWLGMTVAGVILALQRGAAWWDIGMIILIGLIGVLLLAFGC